MGARISANNRFHLDGRKIFLSTDYDLHGDDHTYRHTGDCALFMTPQFPRMSRRRFLIYAQLLMTRASARGKVHLSRFAQPAQRFYLVQKRFCAIQGSS
jgi:hypothetical protein